MKSLFDKLEAIYELHLVILSFEQKCVFGRVVKVQIESASEALEVHKVDLLTLLDIFLYQAFKALPALLIFL